MIQVITRSLTSLTHPPCDDNCGLPADYEIHIGSQYAHIDQHKQINLCIRCLRILEGEIKEVLDA